MGVKHTKGCMLSGMYLQINNSKFFKPLPNLDQIRICSFHQFLFFSASGIVFQYKQICKSHAALIRIAISLDQVFNSHQSTIINSGSRLVNPHQRKKNRNKPKGKNNQNYRKHHKKFLANTHISEHTAHTLRL